MGPDQSPERRPTFPLKESYACRYLEQIAERRDPQEGRRQQEGDDRRGHGVQEEAAGGQEGDAGRCEGDLWQEEVRASTRTPRNSLLHVATVAPATSGLLVSHRRQRMHGR